MPPVPSLPVVLFLIAAIVLVGVALVRDRSRQGEIERVALAQGFAYEARSTSLARTLGGIPSIAAAPRQRFSNVLRSEDEVVFDWSVTRPVAEKKRRMRQQTIVALRRPGADLPALRIAPRSVPRERLEDLPMGVVDFPDASGFEARFRVEALEGERVRAFLGPERRARLEPIDDLVLEVGGEWLIGYRPGRRVSAADLPSLRERVRRIFDQLEPDSSGG